MAPGRTFTVFIVDESESIRGRLATLLETIDDVTIVGQCGNSLEAINGILVAAPDVVLLDLDLGFGSGLDVLSVIRRRLPAVEFIVLTNHAEPQYRLACAKAGGKHFLDKTAEFDRVRELIRSMVSETLRSRA